LVTLFVDIDNFKLINDSLGHDAGDILLQKIAKRLTLFTREGDTIARFSGDEFVIIFITNSTCNVVLLAQKILDKISKPVQIKNQEIVVTASVGVSAYPKDGEDATTLLKNADMAMHLAKDQGRNNFKLYDETIHQQAQNNLEMQIQLRNAIVCNEFMLLYQPTIDLKTNLIIGVEALVRWNHPKRGIIHPAEFIPIAEQSNIMVSLGEWIFRNACLQNKAWQDQGLKPIRMAINVSGIQLIRENFVDMVELALSDAKLDPKYVEIELTESIIMDDKKKNLTTLMRLNDLGVGLTIDDFGTGYSSLNYLREFPVQKLKIDQSFIHESLTQPKNATIVEAIIAMGHSLKLSVLAEGVETPMQLEFLRNNLCDEVQGYLFGQPMTSQEFSKLLGKIV
jgi:diguanylate cyclase (GGDEF)-like protein